MFECLTALLLPLIWTHWATALQFRQTRTAGGDDYDWNNLMPATSLLYEQCYDGFQCARLQVPLDWTNASNSNTVELAIIRLPALVPPSDPSFGGTILMNPGGPGGSGVDFLRQWGSHFRDVVDEEKRFELLSWDPRGVHLSTPTSACFENDWQRHIWKYKNWAVGELDASDLSFNHKWAAAEGFGRLCEQTDQGVFPDGSNIRQYVTTALTARDVLEIIDQVDKHRLSQTTTADLQSTLTAKGLPLLNYWGFSYGTYIGHTFASMFPYRIGRIILDGNVDGDDYKATGWLHNLQDSNRTFDFFFRYCYDAGNDCPLVLENDTRPADIAVRVFNMLADLKQNPLPVVYNGTTDVVSHMDVASLILRSLYMPGVYWKSLSQVLADLCHGNITSVMPHLKIIQPSYEFVREDGQARSFQNLTHIDPKYIQMTEASQAIMCSDGKDITDLSKDDWHERILELTSESPLLGAIWAYNPFFCTHWPESLRPAPRNRFVGPFGSKKLDYDAAASPLFLIGNTADPVTPIRNAFKTSALHEGSIVLTQNTPGHTSGVINPSTCTFEYVRRFFATGLLPDNGTVCEGDQTPWGRNITSEIR